MDFSLSEEQTAIFDMARDFGATHIAPFARGWETAGEIPKTLWPQLAELGFGGLYVREQSGGSGLTRLDATLVFEALSMACPSVAAFLSIHNMCAAMIDKFGSEDLRAKYLTKALNMEMFFSYCLTEPDSGSDAAALKTKAVKCNTAYSLTGTKAFISGGGYSDAYIIMARTGDDSPKGITALIVEDGTQGLSFGCLEDKMGWRSQPTRQVQLDDCKTPIENLLGEVGHGFSYAWPDLMVGGLILRPAHSVQPNRPLTKRAHIWRSVRPSGNASINSKLCNFASRIWRLSYNLAVLSCGKRRGSWTTARQTPRISAPWPKNWLRIWEAKWPMIACNCTVAMAI